MKTYHVYIMSNASRTLYTGMTSNLERRILQHQHKLVPGFTSRYNLTELVYVESFSTVDDAIARERQIKGWRRSKKIALIESMNPRWRDLSVEWLGNQ